MRLLTVLLLFLSLTACFNDDHQHTEKKMAAFKPQEGTWRAVLESPGGPLPFQMTISQRGDQTQITAHNANEVIRFDVVSFDDQGNLTFGIDHYRSRFIATVNEAGDHMSGRWEMIASPDYTSTLPFHAEHGNKTRFPLENGDPQVSVAGRWHVTFKDNENNTTDAVGEFQQNGSNLTGTFLTATGDYRYLEGVVSGRELKLSCFDGGHAFLFKATLSEGDQLEGEFWSRDVWHEQWTAVRDEASQLPDPFSQTDITNEEGIFRFSFPDLEGRTLSFDDPSLQDKVRIVSIFGSWCPNCNDEARFLQELHEAYGEKGLKIVGLAFETHEDETANIKALKRFKRYHDLDYPILLAGHKDKAEASRVLPDLDRVRAFPTSILIDRDGKVVSIHTGFSGPGTGDHYRELTDEIRRRVEALL